MSLTTHLVEVRVVGEQTKEAAHEILAGHDALAFELLRCIFVEDFAQLIR